MITRQVRKHSHTEVDSIGSVQGHTGRKEDELLDVVDFSSSTLIECSSSTDCHRGMGWWGGRSHQATSVDRSAHAPQIIHGQNTRA